MFKFVALLLCCWASLSAGRLTTSGTSLYYNGQKVFLSGANIAWNSYGYDFGNGQYVANSKSTLESWLTKIDANGGNSVRKMKSFASVQIQFENDNYFLNRQRYVASRRWQEHPSIWRQRLRHRPRQYRKHDQRHEVLFWILRRASNSWSSLCCGTEPSGHQTTPLTCFTMKPNCRLTSTTRWRYFPI